jgi:hypothetical protein
MSRLGQPRPCGLYICNTHGLSFGLVPLISCVFLSRHSTFLTFPMPWDLHCNLQLHTLPSQGLPTRMLTMPHIAWLPRPSLLEISFESLLPCNSCFLHGYKTNVVRMNAKVGYNSSSSRAGPWLQ